MRNLKRAFSLVLALVMVLSVVTIAPVAAADETAPATVTSNFSDAAEIKYTEAVAITGGIGLFAGADGKFMPKGTVTRAQMATIIVKMLYGDANADSFKGNGKFSDTASFEGGWAEGYINWCATLGVVAGYGDGTFRPGNQVTTAEAATMILNALKIDAGEGTWPNTVMAKAEEEDFFEDLKPMPGTNTALTREELAVIALNGLEWSDSKQTGWYVTGDSANSDMVFDTYKSAQTYATAVGGVVSELKGRDTLASKVFELKTTSGWITGNQATGLKCTEVTVDFNTDPVATAKFNVVTDATMLGHPVKVWYKEPYGGEKKPGVTYAVSELAEYITLAEDAENTKEYKAAFGGKYDLLGSVVVTAADGTVSQDTIPGYVANSYAPAGTYAIDIESGNLCGYIAPKTYTVAKVSFVDTTVDNEQILLSNGEVLKNTVEDDKVVEYDGVAKDDYVAYYKVQDVFVLFKLDEVTGNVTKVGGNKEGKVVVTLDGSKEYVQSSAAGTISGTLTASALDDFSNYEQVYTFYLDPVGQFVCFEAVEGGAFDMVNTFYVMGVVSTTQADSYGQESRTYFARGIDMTGNEALVPIGYQKDANDESTLVGSNEAVEPNFFSTQEAKGTEEKKANLYELVSFPEAYNPDEPDATYVFTLTSYGKTDADWQENGKFEYGVASQLNNNGTFETGVYCYNHKATKYIVVEGEVDQDEPLKTLVTTGSGSFKFAKNVTIRVLLTRQANGTNNIEAMVLPMSVDHALNGTMIYVDKYHTTPAGTNALGNVYEVHNGVTGEAMEITVDKTITKIPVGFYSVGYDAIEEIHKLAVDGTGNPIPVPAASSESVFENRDSASKEVDGREYESVVYDVGLTAFTGSGLWVKGPDDKIWNSTCSGVKVLDPRTDEQVAEDGVGRITSLDQVWAMKDSVPYVTIELDMCYNYSSSKIVTIFVEVYNNREYGIGNLVYADSYNDSTVIVVDGEIDGMGKIIPLPDGVVASKPGFYYLNATGPNVVLSAAKLDTVSKVALNGSTAGLSGYEIFNATDIPALDKLSGFRNYGAVEYQLLPLEKKDTTVLLVMGAGEKVESASGNTAEKQVSAAEFDSVVDNTDEGITLANLESMQNSMCIEYDVYKLNGDRMLMVVTGTADGEPINTEEALGDISDVDVTNNTDADFDTLAELKALVADGYTFSAKLYNLPGGDVLVVSMCMNATSVDGPLSEGSFATDKVVLSDDSTLSGTITVPAGEKWLLDLNGNTLSGSVAPYFIISAGAELTIQDSGNGGKVRGTQGADAMFKVEGDLILNSGELSGHENTKADVYGGAIHLNKKDASFTMNGGVICGNKSADRGGAIGTQDSLGGTTITINGGEIVDNIADRGNNIYTQSTVTFIMTGGTIGQGLELNGTVATSENMWMRNTTIEISGAPSITGMGPDSTCTVYLADLTDGAYIEMTRTDSTVNMDENVSKSGNVYTNSAAAGGGLNFKVVPPANGTITLDPASAELGETVTVTATPNTGYELKAIYVDGKAIEGPSFVVKKEHRVTAEFQLATYNVTVSNTITGGTVEVDPASAKMGDTIEVTATPSDGNVLQTLTVNGEDITGSLSEGKYSFEMPGENVTVNATFGEKLYKITSAETADGSFTVSMGGNPVTQAAEGKEITVTATPAPGYEVASVKANGEDADKDSTKRNTYTFTMTGADTTVTVTFNPVTPATITTDNFVAGQTLTLKKDSKLNAAINLTTAGTYTLDLDGYTLTGDAAPYITVGSGVTLIIKDTFGGGKIQGQAAATASMIKVDGALILDGGTLTGHNNTSTSVFGGAVCLSATNASFTMNGGTITGNTAQNGAGVCAQGDDNTITIKGGAIVNNTATGYGGGIYALHKNITINIEGGTISGTANKGGAISTQEQWFNTDRVKLNIRGGEISGTATTAATSAIGAYAVDFTMTDGTITGQIWGRHAGMKISGGTIDGVLNVRPDVAGSSELCYLEITGNPVIKNMALSMTITHKDGDCLMHHATISGLTEGASVRDNNLALTLTDESAVLSGEKTDIYVPKG